jgi:hypothetical protein
MIDTKPNFDSSKFEQCNGDIMKLSGCTQIYGNLDIETGATFTIYTNAGVGKYLTSDATGVATWQTPSTSSGVGTLQEVTDSGNTTTNSVVIGDSTSNATGTTSFANGFNVHANCNYSHAEGSGSQSCGCSSHAEGYCSRAIGNYSHAEGCLNVTSGIASHAEGLSNIVCSTGNYSHAEGYCNRAISSGSHAEGFCNAVCSNYSHAEGCLNLANGIASHAEGFCNAVCSPSDYSHAEGYCNKVYSACGSHAEGFCNYTYGNYSHAEGEATIASGRSSHAEGLCTIANASYSHVSGIYNIGRIDTVTEIGVGTGTTARCNAFEIYTGGTIGMPLLSNKTTETCVLYINSDGYLSKGVVSGGGTGDIGTLQQVTDSGNTTTNSVIIGNSGSTATGTTSFANGCNVSADGNYSHAEGEDTSACGYASHTEGSVSCTIGDYSHAEGNSTIASGLGSHAEGISVSAIGNYSHAEGESTISSGASSHAEGLCTIANTNYQHVGGMYNIGKTDTIHEIGVGTGTTARCNAFEIYCNSTVALPLLLNKTTETCVLYVNSDGHLSKGVVSGGTGGIGTLQQVTDCGNATTNSVMIGNSNVINGIDAKSLIIGDNNTISGNCAQSLIIGYNNIICDVNTNDIMLSLAVGGYNKIFNYGSIAAGWYSCAYGYYSFAHGYNAVSCGIASEASGNYSRAIGNYSYSRGNSSYAYGDYSTTIGINTSASGSSSHAEGTASNAIGNYSHAEGSGTISSGASSHAEGLCTISNANYSHVSGMYNIGKTDTIHEIGVGTGTTARCNAFEIYCNGTIGMPTLPAKDVNDNCILFINPNGCIGYGSCCRSDEYVALSRINPTSFPFVDGGYTVSAWTTVVDASTKQLNVSIIPTGSSYNIAYGCTLALGYRVRNITTTITQGSEFDNTSDAYRVIDAYISYPSGQSINISSSPFPSSNISDTQYVAATVKLRPAYHVDGEIMEVINWSKVNFGCSIGY